MSSTTKANYKKLLKMITKGEEELQNARKHGTTKLYSSIDELEAELTNKEKRPKKAILTIKDI